MSVTLTREDIERRNARFNLTKQVGNGHSQPIVARSKPVVVSTSTGLQYEEGVYRKSNIVGVSETLEKDFQRLTSEPDPQLIRSLSTLKRAWTHIQDRFFRGEKDYTWFTSQAKAVRQDQMVQGIESKFAVKVYELHAKVCLLFDDYGEMQQCLTRLQYLHSIAVLEKLPSHGECLSLLMLFDLVPSRSSTKSDIFRKLTTYEKSLPEVQQVLQFKRTLQCQDAVSCFRLYNEEASGYQRLLMNDILVNLRNHAYAVLLTAFRPSVEFKFALQFLGFNLKMKPSPVDLMTKFETIPAELKARKSSTEMGLFAEVKGRLYLKEKNVVINSTKDENGRLVQNIDCVASLVGFRRWQTEHNAQIGTSLRENSVGGGNISSSSNSSSSSSSSSSSKSSSKTNAAPNKRRRM